MFLTMPEGFAPNYTDFKLNGFFDETLREGAERCPFSIPVKSKNDLAIQILKTGVRDLVYGSGPADPANIVDLFHEIGNNSAINDNWSAAFILLLNCWEPIYDQFRSFPNEAKNHVVISLAMLDYRKEEKLFERVVDQFRSIGFTRFRVSLLNNFGDGIDEESYLSLIDSIDRSVAVGIDVVRINDSLGEILPEALAILCANLRTNYPDLHFCLHAHDDRGLGLQNALTSIYYGFDVVESAFAGFGNRSGIPAIETLNEIFKAKRISIEGIEFSQKQLIDISHEVENTFLTVPHVYRPNSGMIVNWENMGVANIPDYLGAERNARRFLNDVGLHPQTIISLLDDKPVLARGENMVPMVTHRLREMLQSDYHRKRQQYDEIMRKLSHFYTDGVIFESDARAMATTALNEASQSVQT